MTEEQLRYWLDVERDGVLNYLGNCYPDGDGHRAVAAAVALLHHNLSARLLAEVRND
jgi:hypothetical protein